MQKKEFKYRQMKYVVVWMLVLGAPFILFVPDLLSQIDGTVYYIVNTLTMIFIIFVLWRLVNILPGVQRTGYFWKENGITVIEYGSKRAILNSVTELMLTDRHVSSQGINLLIRNNGRRIEFLSEPLDKGSSIDSTSLYNIFSQVLNENSRLKMENDSDGEPIDYWYKVRLIPVGEINELTESINQMKCENGETDFLSLVTEPEHDIWYGNHAI